MPIQATSELDEVVIKNIDTEEFVCAYNGVPYRLMPNEERSYPKYLAKHIAKHLANHILQKQEQAENRGKEPKYHVRYQNDTNRRPEVLRQILLGVSRYYYPEGINPANPIDPRAQDNADLDAFIQPKAPSHTVPFDTAEQVVNVGKVEDDMVGTLVKSKAVPPAPTKTEDGKKAPSLTDPNNLPPIGVLQDEADALEIERTGKETAVELAQMIMKHSG